MFPTNISVLTLLTTAASTDRYAPAYVDGAPSSAIGKRPVQVIVAANGVTGTSPSFGLTVYECDTTNGTYTAMTGTAITAITAAGVSSYIYSPTKRYFACTQGTPSGTGTPTANIIVLLLNQKREA